MEEKINQAVNIKPLIDFACFGVSNICLLGWVGLPRWHSGKESTASAGDARYTGSVPGAGRCPGAGNGSPLQYSCLGNPMDRGAWQATVHGVTKNWTYLATEQQQQLFMKASLIQLIFTECMLYSKHCSRHWGHTPNKRDKSLTLLDSHVDRESGEDKEDCRVDNKQTFLVVSHAAKKTEKGKRNRIMQENLSEGKVKSSLRKSQRRKKKTQFYFESEGRTFPTKKKVQSFILGIKADEL